MKIFVDTSASFDNNGPRRKSFFGVWLATPFGLSMQVGGSL